MTPDAADAGRVLAEGWFHQHGLPWFADDVRRVVRARTARGRLAVVAAAAVAVGVAAGLAWRALVGGPAADAVTAGLAAAGLVGTGYALGPLRGSTVVRWAARRTLGSLGLLVPLATRALPLLLLFMTFLFINTEVWQVASRLAGGVMGAAILLFAAIAITFLLARLPEELAAFDSQLTGERVADGCADTAVAEQAAALEYAEAELHSELDRLESANLVLVLLVTQAVQVLLLSIAVWVFFLVFGAVSIDATVITSWTGQAPTYLWPGLVSLELVRVATFLAAFAGLYFTVYAVTDGAYRTQFFSTVTRELERAVSVRVVYRHLGR